MLLKNKLSLAKIVQTERYELAQIPEVPPILGKDSDNSQYHTYTCHLFLSRDDKKIAGHVCYETGNAHVPSVSVQYRVGQSLC